MSSTYWKEVQMSKFKGDEEFFNPKGFKKSQKTVGELIAENEFTRKKADAFIKEHAERHNTGKVDLTLLPPRALEELAKVLEFGANKYTRDGWKKGMPYSVCMASCMRHCFEILKGNWLDDESKLPHAAHAMCNLVFILEYYRAGKKDLNDL